MLSWLLQPAFKITGYSLIGDSTALRYFAVNNADPGNPDAGATISIINPLLNDPEQRTEYKVGCCWLLMLYLEHVRACRCCESVTCLPVM